MLEEVINSFPDLINKILNFSELNNSEIVIMSIQIIIIAVLLLIIAGVTYFIFNKRSREEIHAKELLRKVSKLKKKKEMGRKLIDFNKQLEDKKVKQDKAEKEEIKTENKKEEKKKVGFFAKIFKKKKSEGKVLDKKKEGIVEKVENAKKENTSEKKEPTISLKDILIKKFSPKIDAQLKTKINILDFKSKGNDFEALIEVEGTRLTIILDNSGKIIDYKK